ncbi:MAG: DUF4058 family protein [Armatimonadetes bacterium]|nr:DUF4058 family protein [Anaerolineae bacterium]
MIHLKHNPYKGINAHLHSTLQTNGGWEGFHTKHISDLTAHLSEMLPEGYVVDLEQSLQIRQYHPDTGEEVLPRRSLRPDVLVSRRADAPTPSSNPALITASLPVLVMPAIDSLGDDRRAYLTTISIQRITGEAWSRITWIELLSPTNKPDGSGYSQYAVKRANLLRAGIVLIEIDYLHETISPVPVVPSYPDHESDAYPYTITVTDPRPTLNSGQMQVYGWRVDEPLPTIVLPLALGDAPAALALNPVYDKTFTSVSGFWARIDYAQLPANFDAYDGVDQARIQALMHTVQTSGG